MSLASSDRTRRHAALSRIVPPRVLPSRANRRSSQELLIASRPRFRKSVASIVGSSARKEAFYQKEKGSPRRVHLIGVGQAGIVALHAAGMRPDLFASVTMRRTPRDWASAVKQPIPAGLLDGTVHGALKVYDLPDLVRLIGKDKVRYDE